MRTRRVFAQTVTLWLVSSTLAYNLLEVYVANGFSDADWADDINDHQSTSGYLFKVGGKPVSWRSRRKSCVVLSTAKAEFVINNYSSRSQPLLTEL